MSFSKNTLACALIGSLTLCAGIAYAETYTSEINFGFEKIDKADADSNVERIALYGEHYFVPVDTHEYPYEEAAFIAKANYVYGGLDVYNPGQEDNQWVGIAHYIPNSVFYVEGAIKRYHDELGENGNDIGGAAGMRLFDGMLLTTRYWDEEGYHPNLYTKIVHQLAGGNFINVEIGYIDGSDDSTFEAAFDAYFDRTLSVGLRYADNMGRDEISLRSTKYVTNVFHIGGSINKKEDDKSIAIEAGVRF